jgi:Macrocin-O-methyltransferase (TylF)
VSRTSHLLDRIEAAVEQLSKRLTAALEAQGESALELANDHEALRADLDKFMEADGTQSRRLENRVKGMRGQVVSLVEQTGELERKLDAQGRRLERHLGSLNLERVRQRMKAEPDYVEFFAMAEQVIDSGRTLLDHARLHVLWQAAANASPLDLPVIEIGTYRGGSAFFLADVLRQLGDGEAEVHVFDTFEGHLERRLTEHDSVQHFAGRFGDTSLADVAEYLEAFDRLSIHAGDVTETLPKLGLERVSLAHVDLDLYGPTLDCLSYLENRLPPGGVIVVDDYDAPKCPGVRRAVQTFLDASETGAFQFWGLPTEQGLLVRITASNVDGSRPAGIVNARAEA